MAGFVLVTIPTIVIVVVGRESNGKRSGHEVEDGGRGRGRSEHERRARVDYGLAAGRGAGGYAGYGYRVEDDLPVCGVGDGDGGAGVRVEGWVPAAEAEGGEVRGVGCGAAEVEAEFWRGFEG